MCTPEIHFWPKEKKKRIHKCSVCSFQARYAYIIQKHKKVHLTPEERELFACSYCDNKYITKSGLKDHLDNKHSEFRPKEKKKRIHKCSICSFQARYAYIIQRHKKVHLTPEERELFACSYCDNKYITKTGLEDHLDNKHSEFRTHEPQKKVYRCSTCSYNTTRKPVLENHKISHLTREERQMFACAHCDNEYRSKISLRYHLQKNHIDSRVKRRRVRTGELNESQKEVYICTICGYKTRYRINLRHHKKTHLAPEQRQLFSCAQCDNTYRTKTGLKYHVTNTHIDSRMQKNVYRCSTCSFQTQEKSRLRQHEEVHLAPEERQLFGCAHCDKKYKIKRSLKDHLRDNHIDARAKELRESQKQVHKCAICGFQTRHRSNLWKHKKIHLAPEERYIFACAQCDRKYKLKRSLQNHIKFHHIDSRNAETQTDELILDSLKMEIDDYTPHLDDFKNAERVAVTNKVKSEDFLKIEIDDNDTPILNKEIHHDLRNAESQTNEVILDSLKMEIDDYTPLLDDFKNAEHIAVTNKVKSDDFLKIEIDDDETPILYTEMHHDLRNTENLPITKKLYIKQVDFIKVEMMMTPRF
ncbi:oocyte zinc finger protein XlCOF6-like [Sitophilus oryzae]|uniref:Oocyte zinc finger protein XlCOF6-like n=1 Tax=Sitophilus oryzae TaxID=7048 RepID=A0A6J2XQ62_SITOR|nr:oocyte zinc finger protein XlCOF6-like [Sitophilus oryzae]